MAELSALGDRGVGLRRGVHREAAADRVRDLVEACVEHGHIHGGGRVLLAENLRVDSNGAKLPLEPTGLFGGESPGGDPSLDGGRLGAHPIVQTSALVGHPGSGQGERGQECEGDEDEKTIHENSGVRFPLNESKPRAILNKSGVMRMAKVGAGSWTTLIPRQEHLDGSRMPVRRGAGMGWGFMHPPPGR